MHAWVNVYAIFTDRHWVHIVVLRVLVCFSPSYTNFSVPQVFHNPKQIIMPQSKLVKCLLGISDEKLFKYLGVLLSEKIYEYNCRSSCFAVRETVEGYFKIINITIRHILLSNYYWLVTFIFIWRLFTIIPGHLDC